MPSARPFWSVTTLAAVPDALKGGAVVIGNFDGVHRGHQSVIAEMMGVAEARGLPSLMLTFEPHPRSYFQPHVPFFRLTPPHVKAVLCKGLGLTGVVALEINAALAALTAQEFIEQVLVQGLGVRHITIGYDFCFGAKRAGSVAMLREAGLVHGFTVDVVEAFEDEGGEALSSSRVRACLATGDVAQAAGLLGWHWFFEGEIVHGAKLGRTLGFPTANIALPLETGLAHGIYAVMMEVEGVPLLGVASYGRRPTVDNGAPLFETYLFDYSGDLYGKAVKAWPMAYLRPELKFDGLDALVVQMHKDAEEARTVLSALTARTPLDLAVMGIDQLV